ncbi:hypothetical protein [Bacillus sp. FJAT-27445]|uniref:hypothetical protein n=1 Tax=Bacillus sp. FJAT-27445 TaxID=1679166 RepID=UPI000AAE643B|nr:hypothetical protein [Bacillus sp. FJAT-27445]
MARKNTEKNRSTDKMSGGPVGNEFTSDNAFSDHGLANEERLNQALTKGKGSK